MEIGLILSLERHPYIVLVRKFKAESIILWKIFMPVETICILSPKGVKMVTLVVIAVYCPEHHKQAKDLEVLW